MNQELSGWGQYPRVEAEMLAPKISADLPQMGSQTHAKEQKGIPRGLGRSYGDSSLAPWVLSTTQSLDHFLDFDPSTGDLTCGAGVSLADILQIFVPKGWFLPVTPGTKFVTVGGAIASDVHGKNHHGQGTFCQHVSSITLATKHNTAWECSPTHHPDLFWATCGGMGLTGLITQATFRLIPIQSAQINQQTYKAHNLKEVFELFDTHESATYSVAWIDCLAKHGSLGRSHLMLGEHALEGMRTPGKDAKLAVPCNMPGALLNKHSVAMFNTLYFNRMLGQQNTRSVHYEPFFYPLDGISRWNRLYGKGGFTQYQFVLPKSAGYQGMRCILERIAHSGRGSFLAVLKAFGKSNPGHLSFPIEGHTLALDFKIDAELFPFLETLDAIVLEQGGRIYLSKDVRMSEETFKKSYPRWQEFKDVRQKYGADETFASLQSQRLGL